MNSNNNNIVSSDALYATEDRILRVWTPVLLRFVLIIAVVLMAAGMFSAVLSWTSDGAPPAGINSMLRNPNTSILQILRLAETGDAPALTTLGLAALTLVPLVRVGFCFLLFAREGNALYMAFTGYVLVGLTLGMLLGRIG